MRNIRVTGMEVTDIDKLMMIQAITDGEISYGKYNKFAETALAKYEEQSLAFLVNSGSSANLLAFMAFTSPLMYPEYRIRPGDEIITVATAFPTTITPIILAGCVPVFIDINEWFNIDVDMLEKAYSPKTKGIFIAHTLGIPYDIDAVQDFCKRHNLFLISDCCDALGSVYKDTKVTNKRFADVVTNSYFPAHHICAGEGGAVLTSDPLIAKIIKSLRDWGRDCQCDPGKDNKCGHRFDGQYGDLPEGYDHKYIYSHLGFNLKMTNPQAALLFSQLKRIDEYTDRRIRNFDTLHEELYPWAFPYKLYDGTWTDFEAYPDSGTIPSWFGYPITLPKHIDRKKIMTKLNSQGVATRLLFSGNILRQPAWQPEYEYRIVGDLAMSNYITEHMFWIGCWHGLTDEDILYEREVVKQAITEAL